MAVYRRASRRRYILLVIILTSVTLITLDSRREDKGPLGVVARGAHTVVSPIERGVDAVADPVSDWFDGVADGGSLKDENEKLKQELAGIRDEQRRAESVLEQNRILREQADLPILDDVERHVAHVVNASPGNFEWTVTIDKGDEHGISKGMPVISEAGLVGRVLDSWRGGATILLLRDPESNVSVKVMPTGVRGVAEGVEGSKLLKVDIDDSDVEITPGAEVFTSGLENSSFPEDISVGTVESVEKQGAGLGQTLRVKPHVDFGSLEYVTVLQWVPGKGPIYATTTTSSTTTTVPEETTTTEGSGD